VSNPEGKGGWICLCGGPLSLVRHFHVRAASWLQVGLDQGNGLNRCCSYYYLGLGGGEKGGGRKKGATSMELRQVAVPQIYKYAEPHRAPQIA
jgi:hypothetical protein